MKNEYYHQMPIPPETGIGTAGTDTFTISPDPTPGNISRIKAVYIDLPAGITLDIILGPGQDNIHSNGNEAGSIIFRTGVTLTQDVMITATGAPGTPYAVKMVTEIETPETIGVNVTNFPTTQDVRVTNFPAQQVAQMGISGLLALGLVVGLIYVASKK